MIAAIGRVGPAYVRKRRAQSKRKGRRRGGNGVAGTGRIEAHTNAEEGGLYRRRVEGSGANRGVLRQLQLTQSCIVLGSCHGDGPARHVHGLRDQ